MLPTTQLLSSESMYAFKNPVVKFLQGYMVAITLLLRTEHTWFHWNPVDIVLKN